MTSESVRLTQLEWMSLSDAVQSLRKVGLPDDVIRGHVREELATHTLLRVYRNREDILMTMPPELEGLLTEFLP